MSMHSKTILSVNVMHRLPLFGLKTFHEFQKGTQIAKTKSTVSN